MAGQGKAIAGQTSTSGPELDQAGKSQARGGAPESAPAAIAPAPASDVFMPGEGESEAEARLYAYLGQMTNPRPAGFQPFEALNARLGEFKQPSKDAWTFPGPETNGAEKDEPPDARAPAPSEFHRTELDWFEQRFGELKELLSRKEDEEREIAAVNAKLAAIIQRIDKLSAAMPSSKAITAAESKLSALSMRLDATQEQSAACADRISRAAKEILAAARLAQEAPSKFEATARQMVQGLGQTVTATASRAAVLAVSQVSTASQDKSRSSGLERLENELRTLNQQSRQTGERTAEALDRVHNTLRDFLERGQTARGGDTAAVSRKRAGVHQPISGDSSVYNRAESGFGAEPASKPRLDTLTLRRPPPPDPNFLEAVIAAEKKLAAKRASTPPKDDVRAGRAAAGFFSTSLGEEDKNVQLAGLAIVAFILLLVSGALYYLHTAARHTSVQLSAPRAQAVTPTLARAPSPEKAPFAPGAAEAVRADPHAAGAPTLFTASDQDRAASAPREQPAGKDFKTLESAARDGNRDAEFLIGTLFLDSGAGAEGGAATAARWLSRAAGQGHTEAQFMLASLLERGAGVAKDETQALALYRRAAAAGHIRAMHNLGVLLSGSGSPQSSSEAAFWFSRAASAGLADSQYNLALLYERGLGVEQDPSRAYFWYKAAAQSGDKEAARQAERLKPALPAAYSAAATEHAGSWRPVVEDRAVSANRGSAKG